MSQVIGPRKVKVDGVEYQLSSVDGGSEDDFISAYRVYDFTDYSVEEHADGVTVHWEMGNGERYSVTYE